MSLFWFFFGRSLRGVELWAVSISWLFRAVALSPSCCCAQWDAGGGALPPCGCPSACRGAVGRACVGSLPTPGLHGAFRALLMLCQIGKIPASPFECCPAPSLSPSASDPQVLVCQVGACPRSTDVRSTLGTLLFSFVPSSVSVAVLTLTGYFLPCLLYRDLPLAHWLGSGLPSSSLLLVSSERVGWFWVPSTAAPSLGPVTSPLWASALDRAPTVHFAALGST